MFVLDKNSSFIALKRKEYLEIIENNGIQNKIVEGRLPQFRVHYSK